ncbi:hypothetical protein [Lapidilactobacillus salsurivasis]
MSQDRPIQLVYQELASVHQTDCAGVTNLNLVTTDHGRQLRGFPSIGHSLPVGVSAQTAVITLSGWSGAIRGEIAVKLSLAALPLRTRLSFEIRGSCEAQSDAHSELTPNRAAQAAHNLLSGNFKQLQAASTKFNQRHKAVSRRNHFGSRTNY